ncbi:MAG: DUF3299 domain-containing protein [bacterium]|nr:DUF3299 domain-containing protein [bacterium]
MEDWIDGSGAEAVEPGPSADSTEFAEIQWEELTPPGFSGDEVYDRYADRLAAVDDYSEEADAIYAEMQAEFEDAPVNAELDGKKIRLAGFVTPFNFDDELITEFLLVPYFGACIHVPPPPSNQTILVTLDEGQGMPFNDAWGAVWVTGTLSATSTDTGLATAGYSISGAQSGVYDES